MSRIKSAIAAYEKDKAEDELRGAIRRIKGDARKLFVQVQIWKKDNASEREIVYSKFDAWYKRIDDFSSKTLREG